VIAVSRPSVYAFAAAARTTSFASAAAIASASALSAYDCAELNVALSPAIRADSSVSSDVCSPLALVST
jgi:hypothetical protein